MPLRALPALALLLALLAACGDSVDRPDGAGGEDIARPDAEIVDARAADAGPNPDASPLDADPMDVPGMDAPGMDAPVPDAPGVDAEPADAEPADAPDEDAGAPDADEPDAPAPDAPAPDAPAPDADEPDAGFFPDAPAPDADEPDAGFFPDAVEPDADPVDTGFPDADPPDSGAAATFTEVYSIISGNCSCHFSGSGGLFMDTAATAYANLVNVASGACPGRDRVEPGNPGASAIFLKIGPDHVANGCGGLRMPYNGPPYLNALQIATFESWILDGAPQN
jgi:hypothetical protein